MSLAPRGDESCASKTRQTLSPGDLLPEQGRGVGNSPDFILFFKINLVRSGELPVLLHRELGGAGARLSLCCRYQLPLHSGGLAD